MCAPSFPQCRPEPYLWEEVLSSGMCSKHYAKAHKFSPGAMTFCCGCKHPLILAFSVLDRKEAPQVLLNMLLTRFARLPRFLIYDFACGVFPVAIGKVGWLLMDCTVLSDRFHIFNHLCSDAFDPRSYAKMDGMDTGAPEQRNAPIKRIQTTLQGMGVVPYTNLLAYQTAILNHEAQTKWALDIDRLPDDVDLAGRYFSFFPCSCCGEPRVLDGGEGTTSGDSTDGESGTGGEQSGTDEHESGSSDGDLTVPVDALATDEDGGEASVGSPSSECTMGSASVSTSSDDSLPVSEGSLSAVVSS